MRILIAIFLLVSTPLTAQNTIAIIKYEEAEKAFYEEDYNLVLERLKETEEILGQTAPKILHLRILAQHKLYELNPFESYEKLEVLKTNVTYYLNNYDIAGLEEKYRDVYDIQLKLESSPNSLVAYYEAEKQAKAEKERIIREKEAYIASLSPMVLVEGGSFKMGGVEKNPTYTLSDYYIGKYEVTQKLWRYVMQSLPEGNKECDDCPVGFVTWTDAVNFIERFNELTGKNYRLPTEAEWEFAAIGGNKSMGYKFSGSDKKELVRHLSGKVMPVGKLQSNELDLHDMSGNVSEWCSDWYTPDLNKLEAATNPQGPSVEESKEFSTKHFIPGGNAKVMRGGSFTNGLQSVKIRLWGFDYADFKHYPFRSYGFRLTHSAPF